MNRAPDTIRHTRLCARITARLRGAAGTALLACAAMAAAAPPAPGIERFDDLAIGAEPAPGDPTVRPRVAMADGVTRIADVPYAVPVGFRPLTLDLYLPPGTPGTPGTPGDGSAGRVRAAPVIVYIHGGGWSAGHPRRTAAFSDWPAVLARVAAQGYVVASVEYRLSGEAPFPAAIRDVRTAIGWLRANAGTLGADPDRIATWGASAGGQLAALAAVACADKAFAPVLDQAPPVAGFVPATRASAQGCVQAAAVWYGVFDFVPLLPIPADGPARAGPLTAYLGCADGACDPAQVAAASPVTHLDRSDPPLLLIHGTADRLVPISQSRDFARAANAQGVAVEGLEIPDVDHSFIGRDAAATAAASRLALATTVAFIERTLGPGRDRAAAP